MGSRGIIKYAVVLSGIQQSIIAIWECTPLKTTPDKTIPTLCYEMKCLSTVQPVLEQDKTVCGQLEWSHVCVSKQFHPYRFYDFHPYRFYDFQEMV